MTFSLASVPVGISRLKWPVKYTIKSSSAFYLYFLSIKKRLNVMIPFNLFNILYAFMTMIYILWILIFFTHQWPDTLAWLVGPAWLCWAARGRRTRFFRAAAFLALA